MSSFDAIIIGSGISGLVAARELVKANYKIAIIEARSRIGGRTWTVSQGFPRPVDFGCSMLHGFTSGNVMVKVVEEAGVKPYQAKSSKVQVVGATGPLNGEQTAELFASNPALDPETVYSPDASLFSALKFPDAATEGLARAQQNGAGVTLEELSAKYAKFAQPPQGPDFFPADGYISLLQFWAADIKDKGGEIILDAQVTAVEDATDAVKVTTQTGAVYTAKTVISTLPLGVLQKKSPSFTPALPQPFRAALERVTTGVLEKIVLTYDTPWWPDHDTTATFILLPETPRGTINSPTDLFGQMTLVVANFLANGPAPHPHPTLLAYVGADWGKTLNTFDPEIIKTEFEAYLKKRLGVASNPSSFTHGLVTQWYKDPYTFGATSAPVTLTTSSDGERASPLDYIALSRPAYEGRLAFAGEHTHFDYRGSVLGAYESGLREGQRAVAFLTTLAEPIPFKL